MRVAADRMLVTVVRRFSVPMVMVLMMLLIGFTVYGSGFPFFPRQCTFCTSTCAVLLLVMVLIGITIWGFELIHSFPATARFV